MLTFWSILSSLFFVRCVEHPESWLNRFAYVIVSVLMIYTHMFGIFVLAAHAIAFLFLGRGRMPWHIFGSVAIAMAILLLPLAYFAYRQGAGPIAWISPLSIGTVVNFFEMLAGGLPLLLFYAVLAVYAIVAAVGNTETRASWAYPLRLILVWLFVPIALAAVFSELVKHIFVARYLIITLPPLVLFAGAALARIRSAAILATVGILFAALSAQGLWHYYFRAPKEDWRGVAAFIASQTHAGDAVVCNPPWLIVPLQHAIDRLPRPKRLPLLVDTSPLNPDRPADFRSASTRPALKIT